MARKLFFREQQVLKVFRKGRELTENQVLVKLRKPGSADPAWQVLVATVFDAEAAFKEVPASQVSVSPPAVG
jgi:hypothetical protein